MSKASLDRSCRKLVWIAVVRIELMIDHWQKRIIKAAYVPIFVAAARLITQVEDEDLLETKTGETRGKKTRTLKDEVKQEGRRREHSNTKRKTGEFSHVNVLPMGVFLNCHKSYV